MRERFSVNDEVKWGKLIKSFATGRNYIDAKGPPIPVPRTLEELLTLCKDIQLEVKMPGFHKGLVIMQLSEEVFSIRLPPKTMVDEMEEFLKAGGNYTVPTFYNNFYDKDLNLTTTEKKLDFHAARIGDYSVRMCM